MSATDKENILKIIAIPTANIELRMTDRTSLNADYYYYYYYYYVKIINNFIIINTIIFIIYYCSY